MRIKTKFVLNHIQRPHAVIMVTKKLKTKLTDITLSTECIDQNVICTSH